MTAPRQLLLPVPPGRGGCRPRAGRKPKGARAGVRHVARPHHDFRHPAHVTLRGRNGLPSFRLPAVFHAFREAIRRSQRGPFRVCHFSVQSNHIHMLIEADSREAVTRGVQGLAIRVALAVNRVVARRGKVWADRYHRRDLATPREVRHALVYVLNNAKKHMPRFTGLDPNSSARWFDGWRDMHVMSTNPPPVAEATTWLLRVGWRRLGLVASAEQP